MRKRVKKGHVCYKVGEKEVCIKDREVLNCAGCGRKLKSKEVSMISPATLVWCGNSVCRGQAKFMLEAIRIRDVKKLKELMKDLKNPNDKIICEELLKLMEEPVIFHINGDN